MIYLSFFFCFMYLVDSKVESRPKEIQGGSLTMTEMNKYEKHVVDLELKLSLPGSSFGNLSNILKSITSRTSLLSSSSFHKACLPFILDIEGNLGGTSKYELPLWIAMGCTHCLTYVMVSKVDPECPNCKKFMLIDKFQENPTKKMRTN